ncbi:acetyl-CoA carboxylase biotin carboxyl carrier protein [Thalassobacillus sp. CUG 92003]|uniref:acetyl-CoA carboxylase biotin carboxyl carrier protein n=1 Tax=Thalassobacillus sp. CUG 92003 TaxID=2736641 RepID=UPI0015E7B29A|nr:acetyl-CoA carboxylase biotin carboxyl carrier protein [Thalassobacillus sp. CUG 92003]
MLKVQEIRELIKLIDQSQIEEFAYETNGTKVSMKKQNGKVVTEAPVQTEAPSVPQAANESSHSGQTVKETTAQEEENNQEAPDQGSEAAPAYDKEVTSPMVGTFYQASSPENDPFVQIGDKVKTDSVVCIVEAMKLFNEIEAEVSGEVVEILVEDGELVEYGQPLFRIKSV